MVEQGCMESVDEVYGFHNIPNFDEGDIRVCSGPFFASATILKIRVIGKGGHGSTPHKLIDPIAAANQIYQAFHTIQARNICSKENFVLTICHMKGGHTFNVFPDECQMQGTIRTYDVGVRERVIERLETICAQVSKAMECQIDCDVERQYPAVINHERETDYVKRVAQKWFGKQHLSEDDLPITASEDFSYFLLQKPGCFFALGTAKAHTKPGTLHTSDYDFNDDMVATGGYFWVRLIEDRFNAKILD